MMTKEPVLIVTQMLTVLSLIWLPWDIQGSDHFHGSFTHDWVWAYLEGVASVQVNIPVLLCELAAIWLTYFMVKTQKPTT